MEIEKYNLHDDTNEIIHILRNFITRQQILFNNPAGNVKIIDSSFPLES